MNAAHRGSRCGAIVLDDRVVLTLGNGRNFELHADGLRHLGDDQRIEGWLQ